VTVNVASEDAQQGEVRASPWRPRLVATDLDGTIVGPSGEISDRTVRALHRVEELGVPVVFVTGRPPRWLRVVSERTGRTGLAICANGAIVYDLHTEQVVAHHPIAVEIGLEIARRLRESLPEVVFAVETLDGYAREHDYRPRWDVGLEPTLGPIDEIFGEATVKLLIRHESMDADRLLAAAREVAGDLAEFTHSSTEGLLEVSASGVSKATTLAELCAERGIDAADVIAFGDMPNDLAMLAWAGTAYAVAGAHPEVLAAVERHTGDPVDDGVAEVLERVFDLPRD
jgi:Cof subfamily protein (haloacid dehalogenase superfamily)